MDVGVVTGENSFFVLTPQEAERRGLTPFCLPLVGRSNQIPGLVLRKDDWRNLADQNAKCLLLQLGSVSRSSLDAAARLYIEQGEATRIHLQYKCSLRLPNWWNVPSVKVSDAFMLRQIHDAPRIIENDAGAICTDTIHRVRLREGVAASALAVASLNSLSLAFAEIRGRSYGGGVLELEPSEAEALPLPTVLPEFASLRDELDDQVRRYGVEAALKRNDRRVLGSDGFDRRDIEALSGIWRKLRQRRHSRKSR